MAVNKFDNSMFDSDAIGTSANQLVQLDGSTKIPAVDGSLLTGIPASFTTNASDPTISTNPSGGVGTLWTNSTSGEVYVCTDATAGANVWINIGAGSGNVQLTANYQGTTYGYTTGGFTPPSTNRDIIEKFSFTSDGNGTDVADLSTSTSTHNATGISNNDSSYAYIWPGSIHPNYSTAIQKHSLTSATNGTISSASMNAQGQWAGRAVSGTHGYAFGFGNGTFPPPATIEKFAMAAETDMTDVADLTAGRRDPNSNNSADYGWCTGGCPTDGSRTDIIDKFPFASDSNATDIANLTQTKDGNNGQSSETHGYCCGGLSIWDFRNRIEKFAFATGADATDVANLTRTTSYTAPAQSTTYGYNTGGWAPNNNIEKFSFTSDSDATEIGDMTVQRSQAAGYQI